MELTIKINIEELLGKTKKLDLTKFLALWNDLKAGKEVKILNDTITLQHIQEKKQ